MKRLFALSLSFAVLLVLLASCKKNNNWERLYGFSKYDVVGNYSCSHNDEALDQFIEGEFCHICKDATIDIEEAGDYVHVHFDCPCQRFHYDFAGVIVPNPDEYILEMSSGLFSVSCNVSINGKGNILLHGRVRQCIEYPVKYVNYYFDVVKQ